MRKKSRKHPPPSPSTPPAPEPIQPPRRRGIEIGLLIARVGLPVFGVFVLGWPQLTVALFYTFEVWLFLVARRTAELAFDPELRRQDPGLWPAIRDVLKYTFAAGFVFSWLAGMSIFLLIKDFLNDEWQELAAGGWRDPALLTSLAFVVFETARDVRGFVRTLPTRSEQQVKRDHWLLFSRLAALVPCSFVVIVGQALGAAGYVQILTLSLLMLWIEWPAKEPATPTA